jgi:hypothetical protein
LSTASFTLSPAELVFGAVTAADAQTLTAQTPPQTVTVTYSGTDAPAWTVSAVQSWIQVSGTQGNGSGRFVAAVPDPPVRPPFGFPSGSAGTIGTLKLTTADPDLDTSLNVRVNVGAASAGPTGLIDTPAPNASGLQGSIAVTGWALDDILVDHVEIWRDAVAGETTPVYAGSGPGNGRIFIANALFVPGARPDVEAVYKLVYPFSNRAGWGYMLLTQGLWNQGNGSYTLYAFAFDAEGHASTLGTTRITADNANATKPFGTIDTPTYGGTASGIVNNYGWALTPGSCSISNPDVQVSIDSGALTSVVYGDARSDIAGAFPSYSNAAAAGGHFTLDTTTLANGMHTIGWFVTDSCGHADGIGSRFFTVANPSSVVAAPTAVAQALTAAGSAATDVAQAFRRAGWSLTRNGVDAAFGTATDGTRIVRIDQTDRIEVQLPDGAYAGGTPPIGASFDASTNTFMWQPGPGFLGAYDLPFAAGTRVEKLRVVVGPPVRLMIDTPHAGNVLNAAGFTIAGWAVDLASQDASGIDTLHVWATPIGGTPKFVGAAKAGGARPDVAAFYGPSSANAGFTLDARLPPGTYDLTVYAHSAATNSFAGAQTVRVIVQ